MKDSNSKICAPVCFFVYNRLEETKIAIDSLSLNILAPQTPLYIFSDGAKNTEASAKVDALRTYLHQQNLEGFFYTVTIVESEFNKGLAKSIREGVNSVIQEYGSVIVLEDDLVTSKNFLNFMNASLIRYKDSSEVFSISGYTPNIFHRKIDSNRAYFWRRAHSWGWATWENRWNSINWNQDEFSFLSSVKTRMLSAAYGSDFYGMLIRSYRGEISSWYIRFAYYQMKVGGLTVYPFKSKVENIGFDENATHCNNYKMEVVKLDFNDEVDDFFFPVSPDIKINISIQRLWKKSIVIRAYGKLLTFFMRKGFINPR